MDEVELNAVVEDAAMQQDEEAIVSEARKQLVTSWIGKVQEAKAHWKKDFDRMREDTSFCYGKQWPGNDEDRYVANVTLRHVQQRVATLYAKNPKAVARRRKRLDYAVWDESPQTLMMAQQSLMQGIPDPQAIAVIQDYQQGTQRKKLAEAVGKTLEIVYQNEIDTQPLNFKTQMKQLVRRAITTGVGYVKLGFERTLDMSPDSVERVSNLQEKLAYLERLMDDQEGGEMESTVKEAEELRLMLHDLENNPDQIAHEGLVFDYPLSTSIIIDPACRQLKGFIGASWIAQEYLLTAEKIEEIYGVDVSHKGTQYYINDRREPGEPWAYKFTGSSFGDNDDDDRSKRKTSLRCVYEIYDKQSGMVYTVCDGYENFLAEPASPSVTVAQFFPIFPLTFNDVEHESLLFPPSDVHLVKHMQREHNRAREALREHRIANRPKTAVPKGILDEEDKIKLETHPANAIIEMNGLAPGQAIKDVLQPFSGPGVDPNLYETSYVFDDFMRTVGTHEAVMGGMSGGTATEVTAAEGARTSASASNVDDLDDFLSALAESASMVLLTEMDQETVMEVVGPGATWPQMSADDIAKEIYLQIEAGSSGRPNKIQELQNIERIVPLLLQIPGISPEWLAREVVRRLDDRLDVTEALMAGMPSIIAMNANHQPMGADVGNAPEAQGVEGNTNAPQPGGAAPMPQPPMM